jgi:hypothetical protein
MCNDSDYDSQKHIRHQRCFSVREFGIIPKDEFAGSSLQRKKQEPKPKKKKETKANRPH